MLTFYLTALILILSALGVLMSKNPLGSALSLILNLLCMACLFAALDAHFLAVVQVIVYAGAIMVLIMFALMLLNAKLEAPHAGKRIYVWFGIALSALLAGFILPIAAAYGYFGLGFSKLQGTLALMGQALFGYYLFPFEFSSALILAAIVGAVVTARRVRDAASRREEEYDA